MYVVGHLWVCIIRLSWINRACISNVNSWSLATPVNDPHLTGWTYLKMICWTYLPCTQIILKSVFCECTPWWTYKKQWKDPPIKIMGKSTINEMAIFNCKLLVHQRIVCRCLSSDGLLGLLVWILRIMAQLMGGWTDIDLQLWHLFQDDRDQVWSRGWNPTWRGYEDPQEIIGMCKSTAVWSVWSFFWCFFYLLNPCSMIRCFQTLSRWLHAGWDVPGLFPALPSANSQTRRLPQSEWKATRDSLSSRHCWCRPDDPAEPFFSHSDP